MTPFDHFETTVKLFIETLQCNDVTMTVKLVDIAISGVPLLNFIESSKMKNHWENESWKRIRTLHPPNLV